MSSLAAGSDSDSDDKDLDRDPVAWLERVLPLAMRRLSDAENLDIPLLQLPLAQLRLAQALYNENAEAEDTGEAMGHLSQRLGVRHNALTQAADRLIQRGLAERISDPHDRRVVRLRLTATGREHVRERRERRHARLQHLWAKLNPHEQEAFLHAVRVLEATAQRLED